MSTEVLRDEGLWMTQMPKVQEFQELQNFNTNTFNMMFTASLATYALFENEQ